MSDDSQAEEVKDNSKENSIFWKGIKPIDPEFQKVLETVGTILGITAVAAGSAFAGFKLSEFLNAPKNIFSDTQNDVKQICEMINKETNLLRKLEIIDKQIKSNNWILCAGAVLNLFSEFECFLDLFIAKKIECKKKRKNLRKKINIFKFHKYITEVEHSVLSNVADVRNRLIHGDYKSISKIDLEGANTIIQDFIKKYYSEVY